MLNHNSRRLIRRKPKNAQNNKPHRRVNIRKVQTTPPRAIKQFTNRNQTIPSPTRFSNFKSNPAVIPHKKTRKLNIQVQFKTSDQNLTLSPDAQLRSKFFNHIKNTQLDFLRRTALKQRLNPKFFYKEFL